MSHDVFVAFVPVLVLGVLAFAIIYSARVLSNAIVILAKAWTICEDCLEDEHGRGQHNTNGKEPS